MEVIDIYNNKKEVDCMGCAISKGEITAPGGTIYENDSFSAQQDYEIPIPGFIIIASKRHIQCVDEFTGKEQGDFIDLLVNIRKALREALNIQSIYQIQVENTEHHFNYWLLPITKEGREKFGYGIKAVKPMMNDARENLKTPENLKKVEEYIEKLCSYFATTVR